ncbi:unnamed protein product, partial [Tetraodon nigroviridis]
PQFQEKAISIWESKGFFMDLDPLPGGVEAVKEMAQMEKYVLKSLTSNQHRCFHLHQPYKTLQTLPVREGKLLLCQTTEPLLHSMFSNGFTSAVCVCVCVQYAWVEKHLGHEFLEQVILTRDKTLITGDILIDDKPDIQGVEAKPSWEHILFTACHKQAPGCQPRPEATALLVRRLEGDTEQQTAVTGTPLLLSSSPPLLHQ